MTILTLVYRGKSTFFRMSDFTSGMTSPTFSWFHILSFDTKHDWVTLKIDGMRAIDSIDIWAQFKRESPELLCR